MDIIKIKITREKLEDFINRNFLYRFQEIYKLIRRHSIRKVMVGAGGLFQKDFFSTDVDNHDITSYKDWIKLFPIESLDTIVAEHVLEHLSIKQNKVALDNVYKFLKPGGVFRIAVPDKNRLDKKYVKAVKPPAEDHKSYFNIENLSLLLFQHGFTVQPLEYFDKNGKFVFRKWSPDQGLIRRSYKYDKQKDFKYKNYHYTSLIVDAIKPK